MTDIALHGVPVEHQALAAGEYESPAEYAEQGEGPDDTRVVRDLLFSYKVAHQNPDGTSYLVPTDAPRGTSVTIEQIGLVALQDGETNHKFYTTKELDAINNPTAAATVEGGGDPSDLASLGEYELAEWLATPLADTGREPTINDVLDVVGSDKEFAHRMLQAENIRGDGDPRAGLEKGLTAIIQEA
jgi:hypothetical protein